MGKREYHTKGPPSEDDRRIHGQLHYAAVSRILAVAQVEAAGSDSETQGGVDERRESVAQVALSWAASLHRVGASEHSDPVRGIPTLKPLSGNRPREID